MEEDLNVKFHSDVLQEESCIIKDTIVAFFLMGHEACCTCCWRRNILTIFILMKQPVMLLVSLQINFSVKASFYLFKKHPFVST